MKTLMVFLALLLGTVLNVVAKDISSKDTVNGWYFWKAMGSGFDTIYTRLTLKSYEGKSAQIFGNSTKNSGDTVYWRKDLDKSYLFPKFAVGKASLDSIGTDSVNGVFIDLFVGNRKNPEIVYKMSDFGTNGFFLQHPEWAPRPYWLNIGSSIKGPFTNKPDSIDFMVISTRYNLPNRDPKCEFIVDKLCFAYGKGNPWENLTIDSSVVVDRFGDPDAAPIFGVDKKTLDFGAMSPNSTKTEKVRISNSGDAPLVISRIWTNNPNFSATRETSIVEFGDSANLAVKFNQDSVKGLKKGLVFIEHKGANRRERALDWSNTLVVYLVDTTAKVDTISVSADFKEPDPILMPKLSYFPKFADFGTLKINQVSHKDTLVVFKNTGNDTVRGTISVVSVAGKGFSIDNKNLLIAPMDSVMRMVRFAPSENGKVNGLLVITSNSPSSPDTVFLTGVGDKTTGVQDNLNIPKSFSLSQNYPNPFNPSTTIEFSLPKRAFVNLTIYNTLGQVVKTLVSSEMESGTHRIIWKANNIPSGIYFYRLNAGNFVETKKMILMK